MGYTEVRWRRWKDAYENVAAEWKLEAVNWQEQIARAEAERDEAISIATTVIVSLEPADRDYVIEQLHERRAELLGDEDG